MIEIFEHIETLIFGSFFSVIKEKENDEIKSHCSSYSSVFLRFLHYLIQRIATVTHAYIFLTAINFSLTVHSKKEKKKKYIEFIFLRGNVALYFT
jgi:hypothetical protein